MFQPGARSLFVLAGLKEIKGLNTLVLKSNAFTDLGKALHHCTALSKLSMAHNQLSDLGDSLQVSSWPLIPHCKACWPSEILNQTSEQDLLDISSAIPPGHVGLLHARKWPPAIGMGLSGLCGRAGLHSSEGAPLESQCSR